MTRDEILKGVRQVFAEALEIEDGIEPELSFIEDMPLDSLQALTLVVELENHFEVCFEEGEERGVETVDQLIDLIARHLKTPSDCDA